MTDNILIVEDKQLREHVIFEQLDQYARIYSDLSFSILGFIQHGVQLVSNIDTYMFSSIQGTLESIKSVLEKYRINDGYALLRKYYDATVISIYVCLYLRENCSLERPIVEQIDRWIRGQEKLPEYRVMVNYIRNSPCAAPVNDIVKKDNTYKNIRNRCNDNTHYNFFANLILNDNEICQERFKRLDEFSVDVEALFIQHMIYILYLNDYYMASSDYVDCLDMGIAPEKGSQYFVAPFIQEMFDTIIKPKRYDLYNVIKESTCMDLE